MSKCGSHCVTVLFAEVRKVAIYMMSFPLFLGALLCLSAGENSERLEESSELTVSPRILFEGYDGKSCWSQSGIAVIPGYGALLTAQLGSVFGSDDYMGINLAISRDYGVTWSNFKPQLELDCVQDKHGWRYTPCDAVPVWCDKAGKLLLYGNLRWYVGEKSWREKASTFMPDLPKGYLPSNTWYSVYDTNTESFGPLKFLYVPEKSLTRTAWGGCSQCWVEEDGTLLMPLACVDPKAPKNHVTIVTRCSFNGERLEYKEEGNPIAEKEPRGMSEPQLVKFKGKYWLSMRNDQRAWLSSSLNGLDFEKPRLWVWNTDGKEIGSYNTQQHWGLTRDHLYLVYTRRDLGNQHVFRSRAPLYVAEFNPQSQTLRKETERIAVPERGASLGNFGVISPYENEFWVVTTESMPTPQSAAMAYCKAKGANGSVWLSILKKPASKP